MSKILENLNDAQRSAVVDFDCPSLIVAGAGSGKTRVLTSRIAYMLERGVAPWRILALTFTNKAAGEMRERISKMVPGEQSERLWMGTFHSIFLRILRAEAQHLGYPAAFTIYDTDDSRRLIRNIIKEKNLSDETYKPAAVQSRISLAKNNLVTPEAYAANATYVGEDRQRKIPAFVDIYREYARRCRENGAMDFDDMLLNVNILFKDFPEVLAKYQQRFQYILVDEYQDTNYAQYIIVRRLAEHHQRVCVVGDDSQSIYSFRGARIENILRFRNDYPEAKTFKLEQNYRSTRNIVEAANSVIEKNRNRIEKASFSEGGQGERIKVLKAYTDQEEASMVADEVRRLSREKGAAWNDIALLYRTNMQSRVFEEAFRRRGIPYKIYGGMSFYQRKEIKDVLAYMHLVVNPKDDVAFRRVVNYPARGIGDVTVARLAEGAGAAGQSIFEYAETGNLEAAGLNAGTRKRVAEFTELIRSLGESLDKGLYQFGLEVATRSGIIGTYRAEQTVEAQGAIENIEELLNSMQLFSQQSQPELQYDEQTGEPVFGQAGEPSLVEWLQSITLLTDQDQEEEDDRNKITLMTIHAAKGLEFRFVFIVGLEENLFPSLMSLDGEEGLEEERRLFYVALTRAKEEAALSFSESRFKWGSMEFCRPSRFLGEIDQKYLEITFDPADLSGEGGPKAMLRKNYDQHNEHAAGERRSVGHGEAERYKRGAGGRGVAGGYGGGERYKSGEGYKGGGDYRKSAPSPEKVTVPEPKVGAGTRFRSVGKRPAESGAGVGDREAGVEIPGTGASGSGVSGTGTRPAGTLADSGAYAEGQRVAHAKFGIGTIESVEQLSTDLKITVAFDEHGRKTLLAKFARLAIVG